MLRRRVYMDAGREMVCDVGECPLLSDVLAESFIASGAAEALPGKKSRRVPETKPKRRYETK